MHYVSLHTAMVSALLALASASASAQHPQTRKGFWIGFGIGFGGYGISCNGCSDLGHEGSVSGYLKLGWTVGRHVLLGGEADGWTKSRNEERTTAANYSVTAYYYPKPAGPFSLRAGAGSATLKQRGFATSRSNTGPGYTFGVAYDARISANTSIVPVANYVWGLPRDGFKYNFFQLALGVTLH